jgi:cell division protein FtsB
MQDQQNTEQFDLYQMVDRICQTVIHSRRKVATLGVFVLVLFLGFHVIFGANGMVQYTNKRAEYRKLQKETQDLDEENTKLTKQVERLRNDPKAIEQEAREQLHYTKKGEIIYLLPQKTDSSSTRSR